MNKLSLLSSVRRIWIRLVGRKEDFTLENRICNSICVVALVAIVYNIPFNLYVGLPIPALIAVVMLIIYSFVYYIVRFRKMLSTGVLIAGFTINLIFAVTYFYNSGIEGPSLILFIIAFFLVVTVAPVKQYPLWLILNLSTVLFLLTYQYNHPLAIKEAYSGRLSLFIDNASTYIVTIALIFLATWYMRRGYRSEKRSAEEKARALGKLNAEKNKLFSIISHDLRVPLASVQNYLEILSETRLEEDERNEIQADLLQVTRNTQELLHNLLSWSKAQMNGVHAKLNLTNVYTALKPTLDIYHHLAEKKGIVFAADIDPYLIIRADNDMLQLIVRNMVSNAVKFTPAGGKVSITAVMSDLNCIISVKDTGAGISDDRQKNLFSLKVQATYGTENEKGVGLGLLLCNEYAKIQNGHIWFESQLGKGSAFHLSLPAGI